MQLLSTGKQRAGKTARVAVSGTALSFASWENNMTGEDLPTVNFNSYNVAAGQTFDEGILGVLSCESRFGGDFDAGYNPLGSPPGFAAPPGLYPRDDLLAVTMLPSALAADGGIGSWSFPFMRLRSATNSAEVRGKVTFNCSGKNQGPFTFPTGDQ